MLEGMFERPLGALGEALGGAAGWGLGAVGKLLEPLDYARQATWNLPERVMEGDWKGALPGLLGLGAAAATLPFGGPGWAALGGGLTAALAQGAGKATGSKSFDARNPSDVVASATGMDPDSFGAHAGGFLASALSDPLGFGLGKLGKMAGKPAGEAAGRFVGKTAVGKNLGEAAWARGPMYGHSTAPIDAMEEMIARQASEAMTPMYGAEVTDRLRALRQSPEFAKVMNEIPPGSVPLSHGSEAFTWRTPGNSVARISGGPGALDVPAMIASRTPEGRVPRPIHIPERGGRAPMPGVPTPDVEGVIRPGREVFHGDYTVQQTPYIKQMEGRGVFGPHEDRVLTEAAEEVMPKRFNLPYEFADAHSGNIGRTDQGKWLVTDPGAVYEHGAAKGQELAQPGRVKSWLLDMLGAKDAVRKEIGNQMLDQRGFSLPDIDAMLLHGPPPVQYARRPPGYTPDWEKVIEPVTTPLGRKKPQANPLQQAFLEMQQRLQGQ